MAVLIPNWCLFFESFGQYNDSKNQHNCKNWIYITQKEKRYRLKTCMKTTQIQKSKPKNNRPDDGQYVNCFILVQIRKR